MALNPITYTEKVVGDFLRYQLTAYPFADERLYAQMREILSLDRTRHTPLLRGPYVSLSMAFRLGATVRELVAAGVLHPFMESIVPYASLYGHQERAIRSIAAGRTTLISTGAGSGKTEAFLYPIISRCLTLRDEGKQPRILRTNIKQLELLLTRQTDVSLFAGARLDVVVFDEAHTYGGAVGAETACVGTSATLVDPARGQEAARQFASRFFGVPPDRIETITEEYEKDAWPETRSLPRPLPGEPATHLRRVIDALGDEDGKGVQSAFRAITGEEVPQEGWREDLYSRLSANDICHRLAENLSRPLALDLLYLTLSEQIGRHISEEEILCLLALGVASRRQGRPLLRADFPEGRWHHRIDLGRPLGFTSPDVSFEGEAGEPGTCIYLDGLSGHSHGNQDTAAKDRPIREELRARRYEVFEIPAGALDDRERMASYFFRLARILMGKEEARRLKESPVWFDGD